MYNNNRFKSRFSIRGNGQSFGFSRPSNGGRFNNSRFSANRGQRNQRKSQLEGADINIFMKKATSVQESENPVNLSFNDFNIADLLKQNITKHGYTTPTPIQAQAIKPILEGRDVIGLASTGTGKTAACLIPLLNKIFIDRSQKVLIIAPTRELAVQINEEFKNFAYGMSIYSALLIGGSNIH